MLGKLMKYELKATARYFIPLYIILFCMTILNKIFLEIDLFKNGYLNMIPVLFMVMYVGICIAVVIGSFIIMILRFYQNLVTDEGYLMFTLPVKTHFLILSKLLISVFWELLSGIIVLSSVFLLLVTPDLLSKMSTGWDFIYNELVLSMGAQSTLLIVEFIVILFTGLFSGILMIYASIAIGQAFSRRKILGAVIAYISIYMALQFISAFAMVFIMALVGLDDTNPSIIYNIIYPITIGISVILSMVYFFTTNYIFKNKLNLE